jgi:hypothetical protein
MAVFQCRVRITNSKYTIAVPPFEVTCQKLITAIHRAAIEAVRIYKEPRGQRDTPIEIEVTASRRSGRRKLRQLIQDENNAHEQGG